MSLAQCPTRPALPLPRCAVLRGFDVDQPRNLAKSVTVSEEQGELPKRGGQLGVTR